MRRSVESSQNDLFRWADQIPSPLWDDLMARPASQAADVVGGVWSNGLFKVPLLGGTYQLDPDQQSIHREGDPVYRVSYQTGVVLLTAMANSSGVPPSGRMVTPLELKGGTLFFTGAHSLAVKPLAKRFGSEPDALVQRASEIGGKEIEGADCAVKLPGLALLPLYVLLWVADEEFGARAVIGLDDRALFHLDLGGVFALTNIMVSRLVR